jgi:hypothetical protein
MLCHFFEKKVVRMKHEWNWLRTLSIVMFGINGVESLSSTVREFTD